MTSLFGDFETELAPPDALTACVDALDGLGWRVDSVEGHQIKCAATSGPGDGGATIEVQLTETKAGADIRLIGSDTEDATLEEQELGAVLDQARDAIGEQIEQFEPPAEADASEEKPPEGGEGAEQRQEQEPRQEEAPERVQEPEPEEQPQELPVAGWFPDPYGGDGQRYWDGENWTGHTHPQAAAAYADDGYDAQGEGEAGDEQDGYRQEDDEGQERKPRHWRTVAVGLLVFCLGGAVGALAEPDETKTVQQKQPVQEQPKVRTVTETQTQTVEAPANQSSQGPNVAGAAASSPGASAQNRRRNSASANPGVSASGQCDPNYGPICLDPTVADYDCLGKGDGPKFVDGPLTVVGDDHWQLDEADNDGVACE